LQNTITMLAATTAGSDNIKVANVTGFSVGQKIIIETGANSETSVIKTIGTTGGTTVGTASKAGAKAIPVASVEGFSAGQTISIDGGTNHETAVVASVTAGRRPFGNRSKTPTDSITVAKPLTYAHDLGVQVSGSGITLTAPLIKAHNIGAQVASNVPTPGAPNQYIRKP
jgi:non-reducing end alpha-L-arabinofuranosidase